MLAGFIRRSKELLSSDMVLLDYSEIITKVEHKPFYWKCCE